MLKADSLCKAHDAEPLFTGATFTLGRGRRTGLVGPNGTGKSTLLRILAGVEHPDSGRVILGGMLGTWIGCRRVKLGFWAVADCIAPGLILAQALGRWGNYFNQELYGRPSDLPWAVKIDHPQLPYHEGQTFHPTFLYESLASLVVFGILVWFIRRFWRDVPAGTVFALYATLYSFERIWVETLRIDPAHHYFGQRLNVWVASAVCIVAGIIFVVLFRRRHPAAPEPAVAPAAAGPGHTPTARPEAAIAARHRSKRRRRG